VSQVTLLVGTKRGLFRLTSDDRRASWNISPPLLTGREVYFIGRGFEAGSLWATSRHKVWGTHIHRSVDGGETWNILETAPHYSDELALHAIWSVVPTPDGALLYAGIEPAGLFVSRDEGKSWAGVDPLNDHPTTGTWQPAGGALALHSITAGPGGRLTCAVSAGGFYRSDDAGKSWRALNRGVRADFLPQRFPESGQCVHKVLAHPLNPDRLYQQNHCGVYRSDDGGASWSEITANLPSEFGYALVLDPHDTDTAFVIPEESSHMRATIGGRLRVYRTEDAGASWRALENGLPQENAYLSILREGMTTDELDPCGVYVGTSSGHLFVSADRGDAWKLVAGFLPRIICVAALTD